MADVYIVYSNRDDTAPEAAGHLAAALAPRWTVFWDDLIVGDFVDAIEREMADAGCIIPIWSSGARKSESVRDELAIAKRLHVTMIPVKVEDCDAPYGYGQLSAVDLRGWKGESDHPRYQQLLRKLSSIVPPKAKPVRPATVAGGALKLPAVFFSVSSYETHLTPLEAVSALRIFGAQTVLISAYDLLPARRPKKIIPALSQLHRQGAYIVVDSGNYEAYRRADKTWTADDLKPALAGIPYNMAFSFDIMRPPADALRAAKQIVTAARCDEERIGRAVSPIVHAPRSNGRYRVECLPDIVYYVADHLQPMLVAVPERELGPGLIASARTVQRIRKKLDELPFYQPLHLLGTGNPWSIAILAAAGADSFDGLEWCRVVADGSTRRLYHSQHFDFFAYQARVSASPVTSAAVDDARVDFAGKVALHNLDVLSDFNAELRTSAEKSGLEALVRELLGTDNVRQLKAQMPELFE